MIEVAGRLAFLKIFPLPLGVMVENFTIENSSLQLAENLWLWQEFKQDGQGQENSSACILYLSYEPEQEIWIPLSQNEKYLKPRTRLHF